MQIGERIRLLRKEKKLKQEELAELACISRVAVGNYERGDRTPPLDIAGRIAQALDVDTDYLLNGLETIGQRVKRRRITLSMTQEQLAEKSGYDLQTIIDRENNKIISDNDMLQRLASALDCSTDFLTYAGGSPDWGEVYGPYMNIVEILDSPERLKSSMNSHFDVLNARGQKEALKRVHELTMIDDYTKEL